MLLNRKLAILALFLTTVTGTTLGEGSKKKPAPANTPELADKKADLGELRSRIENLRKDLNNSEETQADAADRLRESERQISRLQRELLELSEQRSKLQKKLQTLEDQSQELGSTLSQQQSRLEKLLYRQYLRGTPDTLQLLLNGDDPNQITRDLHYFSAIAQNRADLMGEIRSNLARKKALAADTQAHAEELLEVEQQQQQRHAELNRQRSERQRLYAQISDKVKAQRKEIGTLQQNEKRMTQLIDRLSKIIAAQAAEAAKAAEHARLAEQAQQRQKAKNSSEEKVAPRVAAPSEPARPKSPETENHYEPAPSNGSFARQQGSLRLPVKGALSARFGSPREGGGSWRGLFIRASTGSEVKAIAGGRVVFADWMRGFGNLLIIDHGDAYLSIYGNNESLLRQVGQAIKGGETVATAGNSGGNPDSGLYFEIRHQGQPVDPLKWASLK